MSGLINNLLEETSIWDILGACVEIFIVYYVIYRVLLMIKGTRAAQMVIGIVLIFASYFVAERLAMTTVSWLLDNFIQYFIIIVIVVFQQDIRRGLMRLGQRVQFGKTHQLSHALEEVLAAAEHLAKGRMGGIVVFEREADLKEFVDHGKIVDARVSKELLTSLFVPSRDNELHDGAVIIDKNLRISRAGVVLPLSLSTQLGQTFGTRHRAALGITEETDAVAIVISEERGEISLCVKGNIARDMEVDTLRKALQELFAKKGTGDVAEEAHAAAEIAKAMAALAAEGEKLAEPRRVDTSGKEGKSAAAQKSGRSATPPGPQQSLKDQSTRKRRDVTGRIPRERSETGETKKLSTPATTAEPAAKSSGKSPGKPPSGSASVPSQSKTGTGPTPVVEAPSSQRI